MLKARGWRVFATARTYADLAMLSGEGFEALRLDYTDPGSIEATANAVLSATGGKLVALFNNGAYGQPGAVEDLPTHALRAQFEANVFGWHDLTRRLLPSMLAQGEGRIVQCSSVLGLVALKYRGAYIASKFALEGLTDTLRLELRGTGVHVSLIEPGPIDTRFSEHAKAAFERHIDADASRHKKIYAARMAQLDRGGSTTFKLGPDAVAHKLVHALEAKKPRPRYYVTIPTYIMGGMRRILPYRLLDTFLATVSDKEV
ncbi:SDR family NAD(P)-dependent oxidoreductase [Breoghania sp. L-A4]|uniref:SDR family NAD(P)-dependent oxidoreductase n=1 Tax=Breoghania sp. L-A4 TaxID=2304600 RepID=UPI0020BD8C16|nr:SDR family NAD(P)-dependent oxidoreductase [Breoghania sp. L-A4]